MAKKKLLDYTGPLFIHPLMHGVLFVGEPGLTIDVDAIEETGTTLYVRLRIERADVPDDEDQTPILSPTDGPQGAVF